MKFDQLIKIAEKQVPELIPLVKEAKLFVIDEKPHEFLPKDPVIKNFYLPFKTVAIEDKASVIILQDTKKKQRGLKEGRIFVEFISENTDTSNFVKRYPDSITDKYKTNNPEGKLKVSIVKIGFLLGFRVTNKKFSGVGSLINFIMLKNNKVITTINDIPRDLQVFLSDEASKNVLVALQEIMLLNNMERKFILEERPAKIKTKKIPRSHQRSKFTILEPKSIRKKMGLEPTGRALEEGYERRRHYRTYSHDRFVKMKGKTIIIEAAWVGPSEVTTKNRIYKVRLDL